MLGSARKTSEADKAHGFDCKSSKTSAGSAQRKLGRSDWWGCQGRCKWTSPALAMPPWHTPLVKSTPPSSCCVLPLLSAFYSFLCPESFVPFLSVSSNVLHSVKSPAGPTPGGGRRIQFLCHLWFQMIFTTLFSVGSVLYDFVVVGSLCLTSISL